MTLNDKFTGLSISIEHDEDGFPLVSIETNGGCYAENFRPTVVVNLNGVNIHEMFDEEDMRWEEEQEAQ